jgi:hypothetical protein
MKKWRGTWKRDEGLNLVNYNENEMMSELVRIEWQFAKEER